jgi:hypothetical protein
MSQEWRNDFQERSNSMKRLNAMLIGMLLLGIPLMVNAPAALAGDIISFDVMVPVPENGPMIRDVMAAGRPWVVDVADGSLSSEGDLEITVRGLVLAETGLNPLSHFVGALSCYGYPVVYTDPFETNEKGDADIDGIVVLPRSCLAPIVFVTNMSGRWLAVTGGMKKMDVEEVE